MRKGLKIPPKPFVLPLTLLAFAIVAFAYSKYRPASPHLPIIISSFSSPPTIAGRASIIDGDTIDIHGTRIRLFGIDAPESRQSCTAATGKPFRCGQQAALALSNKIGSRPVECRRKDTDRYDRMVAICMVAGEDVGAWLVTQGWAIAYRYYSTDYVQQEQAAANAKRGMWQGEFESPWDWRHDHPRPARDEGFRYPPRSN